MIIAIFGFLGCICGVCIASRYKKKYLFFKEINDFFEYFKHSISYSQKKLKEVVSDFYENKTNPLFEYQKYLDFLNNNSMNSKLTLEKNIFMTENQRVEVEGYFNELGKLNVTEEVDKINKITLRIKEYETEKLEEYKKYANVYLKISIFLGIGIGIILI